MTTSPPVCRLEEVVDPARPVTYGIVLPGPDVPDGTPYIRVVDMQGGTVSTTGLRRTTAEIARKYRRSEVRPGDVLLSIRGHVGRVAIVPEGLEGANLTQDTARIAVRGCEPRYLAWALRSPALQRWMVQRTKGVAVQGINLADVKEIPVAVPPLPEQRRIVAFLDDADALCRKRRESQALLDDLLRATFVEMFGDVAAKRSRWPFGTCRSATAMGSGKSPKDVLSRTPTGVPIYGGNGVNGYATTDLFDAQVIVVGRVGQQCGITHLTSGPSWVTDNAIVVRVTDEASLDPVYLATAFQHAPIRDTVTRLDLPFINQDMLKDQPIPLPPIAEQRRFRQIREAILDERAKADRAAVAAEDLFAALLDRSFSAAN